MLFTVPSTGIISKKSLLYCGFKNTVYMHAKKIHETRKLKSLYESLRILKFMPRNLD
jgi:hypothetical protein